MGNAPPCETSETRSSWMASQLPFILRPRCLLQRVGTDIHCHGHNPNLNEAAARGVSAAPRVLVPVFQVRVWRGCGVGMAWAWRGHGVGMACAWYECAAGYRTTPTRRSRRYTGPPFTACRALPLSRTRAVTAAASASSRPKLLIESRSGSRSPRRRSLVKSRIVHFFLILLYIHCTVR